MRARVDTAPAWTRARGRRRVGARVAGGVARDGPSARTIEIMESIASARDDDDASAARGAGGTTTLEGLMRLDAAWTSMRRGAGRGDGEAFARRRRRRAATETASDAFDVAVCGGTLGILVACALQRRGGRVCVIERGELRGREQEWNVSRAELEALVRAGALTAEDADEVTMIEFNPIRCGFHGSEKEDIVTRDVLNCGVSPARLVAKCRERFEEAGGRVMERASLNGVDVYDDCAVLDVDGNAVHARLVLDCMGFNSPIVRQIRGGAKPDGVCVVVGTCAEGFDASKNESADLIRTVTDIETDYRGQYFWEAFPASSGPGDRTTYMFTYMDAEEARPSIASMLDDYWEYMPAYQGLSSMDDVKVKRVLFGLFPTFRNSPLKTEIDRVLAIGDASGIQSPLSFGGLAAILRHVNRITGAVEEALDANALDRDALRSINAYQPALSAAWLFQRCMSVRIGAKPKRDFINRLMTTNFGVMEALGEDVMRPFLQDVVTFKGLGKTLVSMTASKPLFVPEILINAGPGPIADWFRHFIALGMYDLLSSPAGAVAHALRPAGQDESNANPLVEAVSGSLSPRQKFFIRRHAEAVIYGCGRDAH
ncbi:unnamed product [Ostreococcus tauri]|uniref:Unnamed product n=1 Tax=Ostreococcus tauri TaxID=70448 RepID=Q01GR6_OSTTA|nr:unnamed product [Ostreococcus tauri]CAL50078.1 unnamed product [Ostreococcus tauri]|eukprot:XP_003074226.1 unnamed product [Ostreococcus tauri]